MTSYFYPSHNDISELPVYVCGIGIRQPENPVKRNNAYGFHQLLHCIKGEGKVITENKKYNLSGGTIMFIPKGTAHELVPLQDQWQLFTIDLDGSGIEALLEALKLSKVRCETLADGDKFTRKFLDIFNLCRQEGSVLPWESSALAYDLLMQLHRDINIKGSNSDGQKYNQLAPVIQYMEDNYPSDMTLDKLSAMIDISPQYLCKLFKECYKMRPFEYLARKRIQQAKLMLIQEEYSVNEVSQLVGYNDCSYFCSVFKKHEGISPAEFKAVNCSSEEKLP
ncbi:helix-turn-helix domain-containing protein [Ruminococcus sp. FC2018]|uniref:AraC family transcriptional regulator n=1 Tax=Ruminococcus sp. FC2018 TaxID=1410617 RepID=UPI00048FD821|nr:helix-turn-helix domain-containing protein [Ruminococcus sp. FC2018]